MTCELILIPVCAYYMLFYGVCRAITNEGGISIFKDLFPEGYLPVY